MNYLIIDDELIKFIYYSVCFMDEGILLFLKDFFSGFRELLEIRILMLIYVKNYFF